MLADPLQYYWLSKDFAEFRKLQYAYIAKAVIALTLICLAIAFGVALYNSKNAGGTIIVNTHLLTDQCHLSHPGMDHCIWLHILPSYFLL